MDADGKCQNRINVNTILKLRTSGKKSKVEEKPQHFLMDNLCRGAVPANTVSAEEQQIRDDLEAEVEEDLEREIINEMCRLARHLQRLYHQKDRREITSSPNYICQLPLSHTANEVPSEMNIMIKLDGRCKIDVRVEQDAAAIQPRSYPNNDQSEKRQGSMKTRPSDTVYHRKQQNHPVVPWR